MRAQLSRLVTVGVAAAVVAGGWWAYRTMYAGPRRHVDSEIALYEGGIEKREVELAAMLRVRAALREHAARSLGPDAESVSATLRSTLNEMVSQLGLGESEVSTRPAEPVKNPVASTRVTDFDRVSKSRADFYRVGASVRANGSLESALKLLATLQHQEWIERVGQWSIVPIDRSRERFRVTVEVSTVYLPDPELRGSGGGDGGRGGGGGTGSIAGAAPWKPVPDEVFAGYGPVLERLAFAEPPPPSPRPARQRPSVAAGPAYEDWRISAVVQGVGGSELWLANTKSGQTTTLSPGSKVLDATFVEGEGETAVLEIGGSQFEVRLGQTLADRKPARK